MAKKKNSLIVYFDANAHGDLAEGRNGITSADLEKIAKAVENRRIRIPASWTLFEEIAGIIINNPQRYESNIEVALRLIDRKWMIKDTRDILIGACREFAHGRMSQSYLTETPEDLLQLLTSDSRREDVRNIAIEALKHANDIAKAITDYSPVLLKEIERVEHENSIKIETFSDFWNHGALTVVEMLSRDWGTPYQRLKCKAGGLTRMLQMRSVHLYTTYYIATIHQSTKGITGDSRKIRRGDPKDFKHAISAASADIFVTQEDKTDPGNLPFILRQKPLKNLEIMNLRELLDRL